jgi:hypothetical protein
MLFASRRLIRAVVIVAAVFSVWFALGVLTFDDDTRIDAMLSDSAK